MRLGVFGGTFDPPHTGHLIVAQDAWSALGLDRVIFVPAAEPPHKVGMPITPGPIRLELVRAAVGGDERFEVSDLELRRAGPSYTVDTLRALRAGDPPPELFLLIGADQVREFDNWRAPDEILRLATVVGFMRGGEAPVARPGIRWIRVTRIDLSATEIRRRVAAGEPIRYLVPPAVEAIIRREGLYRAPAERPSDGLRSDRTRPGARGYDGG